MGYDSDIIAFKKKTLKNIQEILPDYSFRDLYSNYLFTRIYPDEYNFPEDEKAKWISSPSSDIFNEFFDGKFENEEARVIDKETYYKFYHWLEDKLKSITLYNLVDNDIDEQYISSLVDTYKFRDNAAQKEVWINETDSTYEPLFCTVEYFNEHFEVLL